MFDGYVRQQSYSALCSMFDCYVRQSYSALCSMFDCYVRHSCSALWSAPE